MSDSETGSNATKTSPLLDMVVHAPNLSAQKVEAGGSGDQEDQELKASFRYRVSGRPAEAT